MSESKEPTGKGADLVDLKLEAPHIHRRKLYQRGDTIKLRRDQAERITAKHRRDADRRKATEAAG